MLKKKALSLLMVIAMLAGVLFTTVPASAAGGDWKLLWSDEFNGTAGSGVDTGKWVYETGGGGWGNSELQNYTSRTNNVYLEQDTNDSSNRFLVIQANKESYNGSSYTSGRIKTKGKFDFKYGKIEMRAKLPSGQGMWPAFWMLGSDIDTNSWPNCGEIDIMENVGKEPTKIYGTLHGPNYSGGNSVSSWHENTSGFSSGFHTYAVEWEPNVIRWYFDGQMYVQRTPEDIFGKTWVYDHNFYILLNLAVGGTWPGSPDSTTVFPQKYTIDYVRVYQREGGVYPAPLQRSLVNLKNVGNGKYVTTDKQNGDYLYANRSSAGGWETFEQRNLGNGNIALISLTNYKYDSASASGNQLIASKESVGATETYQVVNNSDGTVSLKCAANGKYVTAPSSNILEATASSIGNYEKFNIVSQNGVPLQPDRVATPVISPAGGTYTSSQQVSISCSTSGSNIRYTTDGSTPSATNGIFYTGPFTVSTTATVKAIAYETGISDSNVASATYTISTGSTNLALNKPATASSNHTSSNTADKAFDGNTGTRWESDYSDPQWITVDLGAAYNITGVNITWYSSNAYAKDFKIQISNDNSNWTDAYSITGNSSTTSNITFPTQKGRYVKMYGTKKSGSYGYSIKEFEVKN